MPYFFPFLFMCIYTLLRNVEVPREHPKHGSTELEYFIALQVCCWQSNFLFFGLTDVIKLPILSTVQGAYPVCFFHKHRSRSDPSK